MILPVSKKIKFRNARLDSNTRTLHSFLKWSYADVLTVYISGYVHVL